MLSAIRTSATILVIEPNGVPGLLTIHYNEDGTVLVTKGVSSVTADAFNPFLTAGNTPFGEWEDEDPRDPVGNASSNGYTASQNATARWDVPQFLTFSEDFNVGVVAWHSSGIDRVEFSVDEGPWKTVTNPTANPQTANANSDVGINYDATGKSAYDNGIIEFWATLRASDYTDGQHEVRAVAFPNIGTPRVLTPLILDCNYGGTRTGRQLYVDSVNGSDSNPGTELLPLQTINGAVVQWWDNNTGLNNATIHLKPGTYLMVDGYSGIDTSTQQSYVTIQPAQGVSRSEVIVKTDTDWTTGLRIKKLHWKNVTLGYQGGFEFFSGDSSQHFWIDGCHLDGPGEETGYNWIFLGSLRMYFTDSTIEKTSDGIGRCALARNVKLQDIGSDMWRDQELIANCEADPAKSIYSGTNLTVDPVDNTIVTPDGYTPIAKNVNGSGAYTLHITSNTGGWTAGEYTIASLSGGKWKLSSSPAAVGTTGGSWQLLTGAHSDTSQWLGSGTNQIFYGLKASISTASGISAGSRSQSGPLLDIAIVKTVIDGEGGCNGFYDGTVTQNLYIYQSDFSGYCYLYLPGDPTGFEGQDCFIEDSTFDASDLVAAGVTRL